MKESRIEVYIPVDIKDTKAGTTMFEDLREISRSQPINKGLDGDEWKFFTYTGQYHLYE